MLASAGCMAMRPYRLPPNSAASPASCAARPALLTVSEGIRIRAMSAGYPRLGALASGGADSLLAKSGLHRRLEPRPDRGRGRALLAGDSLRQSCGLVIVGPPRDAHELLVGGDLEMLEGKGEAGQLGRRVRLSAEEGAEVQATDP